eukprot:TRINITY_DN9161_c0_g1_i1.p1 TRINITY_DN9161_c0_g1~~TRINITY_DN9161_c0_g1_i1.p1  ORF type:complete len:230 (-),score=51.14 TRINITY_DN9161_c0_g1_i1:158-847(-)
MKIFFAFLLVIAVVSAQTRPTCTADQAKTFTKGCYDCIQAGCSWCTKASGGSFCVNSTAVTAAQADCASVSPVDGTPDKFYSGEPTLSARNACAGCGSGNDCDNDCTGRPHCGKCHASGACTPYDSTIVNGVVNITRIWNCADPNLMTTDSCEAPCAYYTNSKGPCINSVRNCWFCPASADSDAGKCSSAGNTATCAAGYVKPVIVTAHSASAAIAISFALVAVLSLIL